MVPAGQDGGGGSSRTGWVVTQMMVLPAGSITRTEDRVGCTAGGTATPTKCPLIMSPARCIRQVWHMYASPMHSTQE